MHKKCIAMLLALVLVLTMLPAMALADETFNVTTADELIGAFTTDKTGAITINIQTDINMGGASWTAKSIGANQKITVNGNGNTVTGLTNMLYLGSWGGVSTLTVKDLTLSGANIVYDAADASGDVGVGAFIGHAGAMETVSFSNCHLVDSHVEGGHWTGGFVGVADGWNGSDGPVFETLTYTGCSVKGTTVTGKGSVGGIIGHGALNAWTQNTITNCTVSGNTINSTGSSTNKAGDIVGTVGAAGQPSTANGVTKTGGMTVNATAENNTTTSGGTEIERIYGRVGTSTGVLDITGGTYDVPRANHEGSNVDTGAVNVAAHPATTFKDEGPVTDPVAKIGNTGYRSIQDAVKDAKDGDTIVIVKSHAMDASTTSTALSSTIFSLIDVEDKITIDWNGMSVTVNTGDKNIVPINVQNGGNLTLIDSVGGGGLSQTASVETYSLLCCLDDSSKLTVDGGDYRLNMGMSGQGLVYAARSDTTVINGGSFRVDNGGTLANGSPWMFNTKGQNERKIKVNGGSFYKTDIRHQYYPFEIDVPVNMALDMSTDWYTLVEGVAYTAENEFSGKWYRNEVAYTTLEDAVNAAEDPKTHDGKTSEEESVTLLTTCPVENTLQIDVELTMDMNGNTILWTGNDSDPIFTVAADKQLDVQDFVPRRNGYTFYGWYTDAARENKYDLSCGYVPEGTSLYARWIPTDVPATGDGMGLFVFAGLAIVSLLGLAVMRKREQY